MVISSTSSPLIVLKPGQKPEDVQGQSDLVLNPVARQTVKDPMAKGGYSKSGPYVPLQKPLPNQGPSFNPTPTKGIWDEGGIGYASRGYDVLAERGKYMGAKHPYANTTAARKQQLYDMPGLSRADIEMGDDIWDLPGDIEKQAQESTALREMGLAHAARIAERVSPLEKKPWEVGYGVNKFYGGARDRSLQVDALRKATQQAAGRQRAAGEMLGDIARGDTSIARMEAQRAAEALRAQQMSSVAGRGFSAAALRGAQMATSKGEAEIARDAAIAAAREKQEAIRGYIGAQEQQRAGEMSVEQMLRQEEMQREQLGMAWQKLGLGEKAYVKGMEQDYEKLRQAREMELLNQGIRLSMGPEAQSGGGIGSTISGIMGGIGGIASGIGAIFGSCDYMKMLKGEADEEDISRDLWMNSIGAENMPETQSGAIQKDFGGPQAPPESYKIDKPAAPPARPETMPPAMATSMSPVSKTPAVSPAAGQKEVPGKESAPVGMEEKPLPEQATTPTIEELAGPAKPSTGLTDEMSMDPAITADLAKAEMEGKEPGLPGMKDEMGPPLPQDMATERLLTGTMPEDDVLAEQASALENDPEALAGIAENLQESQGVEPFEDVAKLPPPPEETPYDYEMMGKGIGKIGQGIGALVNTFDRPTKQKITDRGAKQSFTGSTFYSDERVKNIAYQQGMQRGMQGAYQQPMYGGWQPPQQMAYAPAPWAQQYAPPVQMNQMYQQSPWGGVMGRQAYQGNPWQRNQGGGLWGLSQNRQTQQNPWQNAMSRMQQAVASKAAQPKKNPWQLPKQNTQAEKQTQAQKQTQAPWYGKIAGAFGGLFSDKNVKEKMKMEGKEELMKDFMDKMNAVKYEYKPGFGPPGPRTGVIAQDVQKSDVGDQMVVKDPKTGYLMLDTRPHKFNPIVLASLANLNKRLNNLEE